MTKLCIVFADMVGYSTLCARNENATHEMWFDFREQVLKAQASACNGNVVRMLGDGCLLSFNHPLDALNWCLKVRQEIFSDRSRQVCDWPQLSMRFGAHLSHVIFNDDDIYGDGVNISKRLQERAAPDGVILSDDLVGALGDNIEHKIRYLGELSFKNLGSMVACHEIEFENVRPELAESVDDLPSVAIIPFMNQTNNQEYDYFSEGVIDDIISSLAGLKELRVIARGSTLPFAQKRVDATDIARLLSVRYVLQGRLSVMGDRIRLSMTFEDAEDGKIIFGDQCEFSHTELFEVQDNIVRRIVGRVAPNVRDIELEKALRKPPENFTAYQCTLRALDLMGSLNQDDFESANDFLENAMELDKNFVLPIVWKVRWYCVYIGQGWSDDRQKDAEKAKELANHAIRIDRQNPLALAALGHVKSYLEREPETALVYFDRALQIGPSHASAWMLSSAALSYLGKGKEAVKHAQRGLELSPNDPELFQFYDFLSIAYCCNEEYAEALQWAKLARAENSNYSSNLRQLIVASGALGELEMSSQYARELLLIEPTFALDTFGKTCPIANQDFRTIYLQHLKTAGIPASLNS